MKQETLRHMNSSEYLMWFSQSKQQAQSGKEQRIGVLDCQYSQCIRLSDGAPSNYLWQHCFKKLLDILSGCQMMENRGRYNLIPAIDS